MGMHAKSGRPSELKAAPSNARSLLPAGSKASRRGLGDQGLFAAYSRYLVCAFVRGGPLSTKYALTVAILTVGATVPQGQLSQAASFTIDR